MIKKLLGINVIKSNELPLKFYNMKTKEMEITHMMEIENTIYVSEEIFNALEEQFDDGDKYD